MMTDSQKQDVKVIIEFMFDGHMPQMEINERVAEVAWEMMQQAKICSNGMDFVPRPSCDFNFKLKFQRQNTV